MPRKRAVLISTDMDKQFKMYLDPAFITSLEAAAKRFHRRSGQQVAEEVLKSFFPIWERMEQGKLNRIEKHGEQLLKEEGTIPAKKLKGAGGTKGKFGNK